MSKRVVCTCGNTTFEVRQPARGVWIETWDFRDHEGPELMESSCDGLQTKKYAKTMKCENCGKKYRIP